MTIAREIYLILCLWLPREHAEIATKQAIWETGWFKSYAYTELNNPFGLMWKGKVQKFQSVQHGCRQYYLQIYKRYKGGDYYLFLDRLPYCPTDEPQSYIRKIQSIELTFKRINH